MTNYGMDFTGAEFLQTADLDLRGSAQSPWTPIGTEDYPFRGSYNGNCHTVSGLYVSGQGLEPVGLFGVAEGATIACIDIAASTFSGGTVGAVAGKVLRSGVVDCCTGEDVTVTVTAEQGSGGGIIGLVLDSESSSGSFSQIGFCSNKASVTGQAYDGRIGGILGRASGGTRVVACRSNGTVSCSSEDITYLEAGGIAGTMSRGYLIQCAVTGDVTCGDRGSSGGILGSGSAVTISSCFATGAVASHSGGNGAGGIASYLTDESLIDQCYFGGSLPSGDQRAAIVIASLTVV